MSRKILHADVSLRRQRGVSLLVVLILLLVMSLLGIAVLRSSAMQERMSANMVDRNEAVQAAETGLLVAQRTVIRGTFDPTWDGSQTFTALRAAAGMSCAAGVCDRSDPTNAATWQTVPNTPAAWTTMPNGARYGFTVEYLGRAKAEGAEQVGVCDTSSGQDTYQCRRPLFRVTSYGRGRGVAQVVLQSNIISQSQ